MQYVLDLVKEDQSVACSGISYPFANAVGAAKQLSHVYVQVHVRREGLELIACSYVAGKRVF